MGGGVLLAGRQDVHRKAAGIKKMVVHVGALGNRDDAQRRVERARHEGIRGHAAGVAVMFGGDHRDAGGKAPHDPPEMQRVDVVDRLDEVHGKTLTLLPSNRRKDFPEGDLLLAHEMIAEFARVGEVGNPPTVEVIFRHALLGEAFEAVGVTRRHGAEQGVAADLLGRAAIIDLVELVATTEFRSYRVPQELHQLDPLLRLVAVRAAEIAVEIGADLGVLEVHGVAVEIDQARGHRLLDQVLDLGIGHGGDDLIGAARIHVGQHIVADPRLGVAHHGVGEAPEQVPPGDHLADIGLDTAIVLGARGLHRLEEKAGDEVELDREPRAAMDDEARQEAGAREEVVGLVEIAIDEDVLPGDEHLVHDEHSVVLVETRGERIVEGAAHHRRRHLVGGAADELHSRRIGRQHEDDGEILVLDRDQPVMGDEGIVGEHRSGGDHLGAGDDEPGVGLLFHMGADVGHLVGRPVAVDRRVDDGVVDEGHALLAVAVPALGIVLVGVIEI